MLEGNPMFNAPLDEILVSVTNIIRRSDAGQKLFPYTEKGEENFGLWQKNLLDCAHIINYTWYEENNTADDTLTIFERLFASALPATKHFEYKL